MGVAHRSSSSPDHLIVDLVVPALKLPSSSLPSLVDRQHYPNLNINITLNLTIKQVWSLKKTLKLVLSTFFVPTSIVRSCFLHADVLVKHFLPLVSNIDSKHLLTFI